MSDYQHPSDPPWYRRCWPWRRPRHGIPRVQPAAERPTGAIPPNTGELIALGVAFTTQCAYCIDTHTRRRAKPAPPKQEIAEAAFVAAAVRGRAARWLTRC